MTLTPPIDADPLAAGCEVSPQPTRTRQWPMLLVLLAFAALMALFTAKCATAPGAPNTQADQVTRIIAAGGAIGLSVDDLLNGSTPEKRATLRRRVAIALRAIGGDRPAVDSLATVIERNGVLTAEERAALLAEIQHPVVRVLVDLTATLHTTGAFNKGDWREAVGVLLEWAAQPPPQP